MPRAFSEVARPEAVDEDDDDARSRLETENLARRGVVRAAPGTERVGDRRQDETEVGTRLGGDVQPRAAQLLGEVRHGVAAAAVAAESTRANSTASWTAAGPSASPLMRSTRSSVASEPE